MKWQSPKRMRLLMLMIVAVLLRVMMISILPAAAQALPVSISENKTGEVSAASPMAEFTLSVPNAQTAQIQVLSATSGFAPFFSVTDVTNGMPLVTAGVDGEQAIVQETVTLAPDVTYVIQIQSANGVFGQFLLSVQPGSSIEPATALTAGQPVSDQVSADSPSKQYRVNGDPAQIQILNVQSDTSTGAPRVTLRNSDSGETMASSGSHVLAARFRLRGVQNYMVEVEHDGSDAPIAYTICVEFETGAEACPGSRAPALLSPTATLVAAPPTFQAITIPANGPCSLMTSTAATINVRSGPGTDHSVVAQLAANIIVPVSRKVQDNSWYEVTVRGIVGWVAASVVRIGGSCDAVPIANAPAPAADTATPAPVTNATATPSPTHDGAATPTDFVIATFIAPPTPTPFIVFATLFVPTQPDVPETPEFVETLPIPGTIQP